MIEIASIGATQDLLKSLSGATGNGKGYLDGLWQIFLFKGELYSVVNKSAAAFAVIPLALWVINHFRNQQRSLEEARLDTGDFIRYLILGVLLFGLFNPSATAQGLYDGKIVAFKTAGDINQAAVKIANDPVTLLAATTAAERSLSDGIDACNKEPDATKRAQCITDAKQNALAGVGGDNANFLSGIVDTVLDPLHIFFQTIFLAFGVVFLLLLEVTQLLCCLFFPFILLISIADYDVLWGWLKTFITVTLVRVAYNICVISVSFAIAQSGNPDTLVWAVVVGLGAPWLSIEVVTGSNFGILSNMGALASRVVSKMR